MLFIGSVQQHSDTPLEMYLSFPVKDDWRDACLPFLSLYRDDGSRRVFGVANSEWKGDLILLTEECSALRIELDRLRVLRRRQPRTFGDVKWASYLRGPTEIKIPWPMSVHSNELCVFAFYDRTTMIRFRCYYSVCLIELGARADLQKASYTTSGGRILSLIVRKLNR